MTDQAAVIVVRFEEAGFHRWPDAVGKRAYLAALHRHKFHVQVKLEVHHDDREVEFHDLLDVAREAFREILATAGEDGKSCETMGRELLLAVLGTTWDAERPRLCRVSVFEDGEVGAEVGDVL